MLPTSVVLMMFCGLTWWSGAELVQEATQRDGRGRGHVATGPDKRLWLSNVVTGRGSVGSKVDHEGEGGGVLLQPQDPEVGHSLTVSIHQDRACQPWRSKGKGERAEVRGQSHVCVE